MIDLSVIHWCEMEGHSDWQLCDPNISTAWKSPKYPDIKLPEFLWERGGNIYTNDERAVTCPPCQKLLIDADFAKRSKLAFIRASTDVWNHFHHKYEGSIVAFKLKFNNGKYNIVVCRSNNEQLKWNRELLFGNTLQEVEYWLCSLFTKPGKLEKIGDGYKFVMADREVSDDPLL